MTPRSGGGSRRRPGAARRGCRPPSGAPAWTRSPCPPTTTWCGPSSAWRRSAAGGGRPCRFTGRSRSLLLVLIPLGVLAYRCRRAPARATGRGARAHRAVARRPRRPRAGGRCSRAALFVLALVADGGRRWRGRRARSSLPVGQGTVDPGVRRVRQHGGHGPRRRPAWTAAKAIATDFVQHQPPGIAIGIVAFSDSGVAVQAPSTDQAEVLAAIDRLAPAEGHRARPGDRGGAQGHRGRGGRAVTSTTTRNASPAPTATPTPAPVPPGSHGSAAIVLLTDGENNERPDPMTVAQAGRRPGHPRSTRWASAPPPGPTSTSTGSTSTAQLDEALLQQIATATDGAYYAAPTARAADRRVRHARPEGDHPGPDDRADRASWRARARAHGAGAVASLALLGGCRDPRPGAGSGGCGLMRPAVARLPGAAAPRARSWSAVYVLGACAGGSRRRVRYSSLSLVREALPGSSRAPPRPVRAGAGRRLRCSPSRSAGPWPWRRSPRTRPRSCSRSTCRGRCARRTSRPSALRPRRRPHPTSSRTRARPRRSGSWRSRGSRSWSRRRPTTRRSSWHALHASPPGSRTAIGSGLLAAIDAISAVDPPCPPPRRSARRGRCRWRPARTRRTSWCCSPTAPATRARRRSMLPRRRPTAASASTRSASARPAGAAFEPQCARQFLGREPNFVGGVRGGVGQLRRGRRPGRLPARHRRGHAPEIAAAHGRPVLPGRERGRPRAGVREPADVAGGQARDDRGRAPGSRPGRRAADGARPAARAALATAAVGARPPPTLGTRARCAPARGVVQGVVALVLRTRAVRSYVHWENTSEGCRERAERNRARRRGAADGAAAGRRRARGRGPPGLRAPAGRLGVPWQPPRCPCRPSPASSG